MSHQSVLVTGGCGFVGSSLALRLKRDRPGCSVTCLDNLKRRGSELNIPRLKAAGIQFVHGDIRNREDLEQAGDFQMLLECSAEPSVLAGYGSSPDYLMHTNLVGTYNCLEAARARGADFVFLSTSRVYPMRAVNALAVREADTRFELLPEQAVPGASARGIAEDFPLTGARSLYGATKLASELIIAEYVEMYGLRAVVDRCGLLTGPWQFGKVDQGVVALWAARHHWKGELAYFGYGGQGKQVRDMLHVDDLYDLLAIQLAHMDKNNGKTYNVGGGRTISLSLMEMTDLCRDLTGNRIPIKSVPQDREADIRIYLTDTTLVETDTGWSPRRTPRDILGEIVRWIRDNETMLEGILK